MGGCKGPRTRLPVGASALGFFVLGWLYIFPVYRLPDQKAIVHGVLLQQGRAWRRNLSAAAGFSCEIGPRYCRLLGYEDEERVIGMRLPSELREARMGFELETEHRVAVV
ncbi:UNVERIFIED_CONTAM: hypothetical protein K2H54_075485 [Gekko kuhli]